MTIYLAIRDSMPTGFFEIEAVPRIGEAIQLGETIYQVTNVCHELRGRGTKIVVHIR